MTEAYDRMLSTPGRRMIFDVNRDADATDRDGLGATLSQAAMETLGRSMVTWVGTRILRAHEETGLMPQRVEVEVSVTMDTDALGDDPA